MIGQTDKRSHVLYFATGEKRDEFCQIRKKNTRLTSLMRLSVDGQTDIFRCRQLKNRDND